MTDKITGLENAGPNRLILPLVEYVLTDRTTNSYRTVRVLIQTALK